MKTQESKNIFLTGESLMGPVTIEDLVDSKDPKDIPISDLPPGITYVVGQEHPIKSIMALDSDQLEFHIHYQAIVNHGYLYWDDVIGRYGRAFVWVTEHCDEMSTMNLSVDINDSVILECVVIYEEITLADALRQVASLLNELKYRFRMK